MSKQRTNSADADAAWADYIRALRGMMPLPEALKIEKDMRPAHEARWARIERAQAGLPHRAWQEHDIE